MPVPLLLCWMIPARLMVALVLWPSLLLLWFRWRISREVLDRTGLVTISTLTLALCWLLELELLYRLLLVFFMLLICAVLSLLRILLLRELLFRIGELPRLMGFLKVTCSSFASLFNSRVLLEVEILRARLLPIPVEFRLAAMFGCDVLRCATVLLLIESVFCRTNVLDLLAVVVVLWEVVVLEVRVFSLLAALLVVFVVSLGA